MILYVLLIAHFLADFTFQSDELAEDKRKDPFYLDLHSAIYSITMIIACFLVLEPNAAGMTIGVLVVSHHLIDLIRVRIDDRSHVFASFLIDQGLHLGTICLLVQVFQLESAYSELLCSWLQVCPVQLILSRMLLFVAIMDPASVFVKLLSSAASGDISNHAAANASRIGHIIGKLERLIISILVLEGALSSIGFVLTAKSLARHTQLNDKKFAESYLIGTLSSTAFAIIVTLLLK